MKFFWIHVSEGTQFTGFGPFESEGLMRDFRATYADDEDDDGARRLVDDIPPLPGISSPLVPIRDNHETDSWIPIAATGLELMEGWPLIDPSQTG